MLHHAPDAAIHRLLVSHMTGLMNWSFLAPKSRLLHALCADIAVLLEDEHVSSNAINRWQQFLHQQSSRQHYLLIL